MKIKLSAALCCAVLLTGCVTNKYEWGAYNQGLYNYYKNPTTQKDFKKDLTALLQRSEKQNKKPAPGLYAELGTLCLESGDKAGAIANYKKESAAWPESKPLMDTLIKNLDKPAAEVGAL
jgi:hypothetical protein